MFYSELHPSNTHTLKEITLKDSSLEQRQQQTNKQTFVSGLVGRFIPTGTAWPNSKRINLKKEKKRAGRLEVPCENFAAPCF